MNQTIYNYRDENRNILYSKVRITNPDNTKTFYWERNENGIIIKNINECRKVLYHFPTVLDGIARNLPIFLVEGEKDAETLLSYPLIATTSHSSLVWTEEFTKLLENADVVLLYDYDTTGFKRRDLICKALYGRVKKLRVIDLPGLECSDNHGQDITDWLAIPGNSFEKLLALVENTPEYHPPQVEPLSKQKGPLYVITINELLTLKLPERTMLLHPFLPSQGLVMLAAKRGVGKTHVALGIAYAVASGGSFLNWHAPIAKNVLYIDGEMPAAQIQERLRIIIQMSDTQPTAQSLQIITPDLQDQPLPDLSHKKGRDTFEEYITDRDLIVIDNISCLFRSGSENDAESWQEAQEWALNLRRQGKSILFVHHNGKSGTQRGTSKKEDILDAIVTLKHPDDYIASDGARFIVSFDKARHFYDSDAQPFQAHLKEENDQYVWHISKDNEGELIGKIAHMRATGSTIQHIAQTTGLTKSQVETLSSKAKKQGLFK